MTWWQYAALFKEECFDSQQLTTSLKSCSDKLIEKLSEDTNHKGSIHAYKQCAQNIDYQNREIVSKSNFDLKGAFEKNYHMIERYHTWFTPTIIVNGQMLQVTPF